MAFAVADKNRLVQVVANRLDNSAKDTLQSRKIQLLLDVQDQYVPVTATDIGIGMTPDLLPGIFDLSTQGKRTTYRAQVGARSTSAGQVITVATTLPLTKHSPDVAQHSANAAAGLHAEPRLVGDKTAMSWPDVLVPTPSTPRLCRLS